MSLRLRAQWRDRSPNLRLKGSREKWGARQGSAHSNVLVSPFFSSHRDCSFITYSVPIAPLWLMRYIRTRKCEQTMQSETGDINSGSDASLIVRTVNAGVISAIADNGGHSMKINREAERNGRTPPRPRSVNLSPFARPAHFYHFSYSPMHEPRCRCFRSGL